MAKKPGVVVWFVGLSGSGKTTISRIVERRLQAAEAPCAVLDGDELRQALSADLGFAYDDRMKHVRRTSFVAELLSRNGIVVLAPLITPYREMREQLRMTLGDAYTEVYVQCPLETCIARDTKGLYRKAMDGKLPLFTGIGDRFDEPDRPDLTLRTDRESPEESASKVVGLLRFRGVKCDAQSR